jgi:hypothetical protein
MTYFFFAVYLIHHGNNKIKKPNITLGFFIYSGSFILKLSINFVV